MVFWMTQPLWMTRNRAIHYRLDYRPIWLLQHWIGLFGTMYPAIGLRSSDVSDLKACLTKCGRLKSSHATEKATYRSNKIQSASSSLLNSIFTLNISSSVEHFSISEKPALTSPLCSFGLCRDFFYIPVSVFWFHFPPFFIQIYRFKPMTWQLLVFHRLKGCAWQHCAVIGWQVLP